MGVAGIETTAEAALTAAAVIRGVVHHCEPIRPGSLLCSWGGSRSPEGRSGRDASLQRGGDVAARDGAGACGRGAWRLRGAPAGGEQVAGKGPGSRGDE